MVTVTASESLTSTQVRLARRPEGNPRPADWTIDRMIVEVPQVDQVVVEVLYVSIDPAMRTWVGGARTYREPVNPGDVIPAAGIGRVVQSTSAHCPVGALVTGDLGVQSHAVVPARGVMLLGDVAEQDIPLHLGVLGISGLTAWVGLHAVAAMQPGETVVVSGAAGAVGSAAGQLARSRGARVVGVAGGPDKCQYVTETLGLDACVDHRSLTLAADVAAATPDGIDVFFDNVGGAVLEAGLANLALGARILLCGAISQYNEPTMRGPSNYMELLVARASMTGFLVFDHAASFREARREIGELLASGTLHVATDVRDGLDSFPDALADLFTGRNLGKLLIRVTDSDRLQEDA